MLKTLFLHPLGPALLLALGGLLLQLCIWLGNSRPVFSLTRPGATRARGTSPGPGTWDLPLPGQQRGFRLAVDLLALLLVAGAGITLILLRRLPPTAGDAFRNTHWSWQPLTVAGSELSWQLDGWSWLVALLLILVLAAGLLLQEVQATPTGQQQTPRLLYLGATALAFVSAANPVTLAACWVLMDAALALRLNPGLNAQTAGRAWSLLSLTSLLMLAVLLLLGEAGIRTPLATGPFDRMELALLWLAALVRAGVYPFHLWLTGQDRLEPGNRIALHLIVPLTGLWLLARAHGVAGPAFLRGAEWAGLGALALLGSGLAAWAAETRELAWRWVAINRASLVVMAAYTAGEAGPPALAWALVTFCFGLTLLIASDQTRGRWGWSWSGWLGALVIWGLPGTPGFLARSALVLPVGAPGAVLLFVITVVAETLLVATLWRLVNREQPADAAAPADPVGQPWPGSQSLTAAASSLPPPPQPAPRLGLAHLWEQLWSDRESVLSFAGLGVLLVLLAVPALAWGVAPRQLGSLLGQPGSGFNALPLVKIIIGARRSVWGTLILSGLLGVGLGLMRKKVFAGMRGWQQGITSLVGLEWVYQASALGFAVGASGLRYFATLGEGQGYIGWLLLAALILWVVLRG
jgi:hypothetical protein